MAPQCRRYHADRLQQPSAHAQQSDLKRQPEHELWLAAFLDHAPFGAREVDERLDLKRAQLARQALEPEARRVPVVMYLHPRRGHISGVKSANSNRLIWLGNPDLLARIAGESYRHYWQGNQGDPE